MHTLVYLQSIRARLNFFGDLKGDSLFAIVSVVYYLLRPNSKKHLLSELCMDFISAIHNSPTSGCRVYLVAAMGLIFFATKGILCKIFFVFLNRFARQFLVGVLAQSPERDYILTPKFVCFLQSIFFPALFDSFSAFSYLRARVRRRSACLGWDFFNLRAC